MKNKIFELRKDKKLTQEALAKKCSVTRQTINAIENDRYDPTLKLAFELAQVLETTVDDIFKD
ncbi:putative transcriptional regulator [Carnobacterium iners]|uniref:Putative transcriptional regulator n=1 Tax=Carnobacterium iners TaxID=1073423 RepID=A0A1X7NKE3_9LACT|nr:helix-turn-helix transcriptional regulator [Carnobacterium iners]SEK82774.1 putative transcriptional regulator [Carnobacterium iners]SMH38300.1 putative transcriptional regulator [Carnobacterium iners]